MNHGTLHTWSPYGLLYWEQVISKKKLTKYDDDSHYHNA